MSVAEISARIEALAPDRTTDRASVIALSDACFALEGGMSRVFDFARPAHAECMVLRQRCLELMRSWLPLLDRKTLKALEWRVKDRGTPIDLSARKAELKRGTVLDRTSELAPFRELPSLDGYHAIAALYVEKRLAIGEWPGKGINVVARPGVWLAYSKETAERDGLDDDDVEDDEDDDEAPADELLCVHAGAVARIDALRAGARRLPKELPIDGARMAVADATAAKDDDIIEALGENDEDVYRGRAAQLFLDGDGHAFVSVASEDEQVVLALVEIY